MVCWNWRTLAALAGGFVCAATAREEEVPDLLPPLPLWEHVASLSPRVGYKDNVSLAHTAPEESLFVGAGLELVLLRPLGEAAQFEFVGAAEDRRYLSAESVEKEQTVLALAQAKRIWEPSWQGTWGLEYLYQDQILDVSITETNLAAVRVRGHTIAARPALRHDLGPAWAEAQGNVQRQFFQAPLDDFWEAAYRFVWGLPYGNKSEFTISYEFGRRWYDEDQLRTELGVPIPGTRRELRLQELRLTLRHQWDSAQRWRTTTRLSGRLNEDSGSGYFDYARGQILQQIRYRGGKWELHAEARLGRYEYALQTVSAIDPSLRKRDELMLGFRCERKLTKSLKLFGDYSYERTLSSRTIEEYEVNTVSGGLNWEF